ncbi:MULTISPECIES: dihydrofolate reductase family protein [Trichocoleus]|uniref:Dihydrofolate reductase family protein n=1 Tax=Trichocoleus desertorum GB2-A4 TaxID=2933944 RepID=A0ABV0J9U5_9CYAN|nr:dihydrofolate reductase family protein [Trichocoleus sp. FACHB-46]MBD1862871.1 dihydrofolate reductase [Trichocoleus sp. FACHB-46]
MRSIQLFIATSLDGYIARTSGDVDWLFTDQDYGYTEFFEQVDTVLMGRKTYEQVLGFGEYPYHGKKGYVFSKTQQQQQDENVEFVSADWVNFLNQLRHAQGQNIWLVGGSELIRFCLQHGFVDELILSIHPIILGDGIPLIAHDPTLETLLKLQHTKNYETGLLQVTYAIQKQVEK